MGMRGRAILCGCAAIGFAAVMAWAMAATCVAGEPDSAGRTELRLRLHWVPQSQFAGYLVAIEKGFYRDEGLPPVRLIAGEIDENQFRQLSEGEVDFCTGWLADGILSRSDGADVVELAQVFATSSQMFVARAGSEIRSPADFSGKRVGLWLGRHRILPKLFLDAHSLSVQEIPQTESLVPFLRGAVDICSATYYNEYHMLAESGLRPEDLRTFPLADGGLGFPEDAIFASGRLWSEDPDLCRRFVRASLRGWEYAFANEAETVDTVLRSMGNQPHSNPSHQRWMLRAVHAQFPERRSQWGRMSPQVYEKLCDTLLRAGVIQEPPRFDDFFVGEPME